MTEKIKIVKNNVSTFKKVKEFEEQTEEEQRTTTNLTVWCNLNEFLEESGKRNEIEGAIIILKTTDEVRSNALNMTEDEIISTLEEFKSRHYFYKFMEELHGWGKTTNIKSWEDK